MAGKSDGPQNGRSTSPEGVDKFIIDLPSLTRASSPVQSIYSFFFSLKRP
jgi:hypothetical protein